MPVSRLLAKITREYERKGYSKRQAQRISRATVYGKIEPARRGRKKG
jgi:hypothetical protein